LINRTSLVRSLFVLSLLSLLSAPIAYALPPLLHGNATQAGNQSTDDTKSGVVRETSSSDTLESACAHSDKLSSVTARLKIGAELKAEDRPSPPCTGLWFRVPKWVAGVWKPGPDDVFTFKTDYTQRIGAKTKTDDKEAVEPLRVGHGRDLTGQVWHFECIPSCGIEKLTPGDNLYLFPQEAQMQQFSGKVVFKEKFIAVELAPNTTPAKIINTTQHEYIVGFSRYGDNGITVEESEKVFDESGAPLRLLTVERKYGLQEPFAPPTDATMISSFEQFLKSNGMADRVPKPAPATGTH